MIEDPIVLPNRDNEILSSIISSRLKPILNSIISTEKQCGLPNRQIFNNHLNIVFAICKPRFKIFFSQHFCGLLSGAAYKRRQYNKHLLQSREDILNFSTYYMLTVKDAAAYHRENTVFTIQMIFFNP